MTLSPALMRQSRQIEVRSRRLVRNAFTGAYHSIYKGRGMMFKGVRPYVAGDDVRHIDWKVTARTGTPYIKEYVEERELSLLLVIDASASLFFGTETREKRELATELSAVLAYSAITNQDKAGILLFSDEIERFVPPAKGQHHVLKIIHTLLTFSPKGRGTDLGLALNTVNRVIRQGAIVVILSDFLMDAEGYRRALVATGKRHETLAVVINDPLEQTFPDVGMVGLEGAEDGRVAWVDTSDKAWQNAFKEKRQSDEALRDEILLGAGIDRVDIPPDGDYVRALIHYFRSKAQSKRR